MGGKRREPDPTRLWVTTGEAARILRCRVGTVRSRIESGKIEGGQKPSGKWYVYADQVYPHSRPDTIRTGATQTPPADQERLARENAELRAQIAELRAANSEDRARAAEAQNTQIVAALHAMNEVLGQFQKGAELSQGANTHFQAASSTMSKVMSALLDTVSLTNTPQSPEGL